MGKFIKLTQTFGSVTYFNVDNIVGFKSDGEKTFVVCLDDDSSYMVQETPDEILALIDGEAKSRRCMIGARRRIGQCTPLWTEPARCIGTKKCPRLMKLTDGGGLLMAMKLLRHSTLIGETPSKKGLRHEYNNRR